MQFNSHFNNTIGTMFYNTVKARGMVGTAEEEGEAAGRAVERWARDAGGGFTQVIL